MPKHLTVDSKLQLRKIETKNGETLDVVLNRIQEDLEKIKYEYVSGKLDISYTNADSNKGGDNNE